MPVLQGFLVNPGEPGAARQYRADDERATLSFDATALYFRSDRVGGVGANDVYVSARGEAQGAGLAGIGARPRARHHANTCTSAQLNPGNTSSPSSESFSRSTERLPSRRYTCTSNRSGSTTHTSFVPAANGRDLEPGILRKHHAQPVPAHELAQETGEVRRDSPVPSAWRLAHDQPPPDELDLFSREQHTLDVCSGQRRGGPHTAKHITSRGGRDRKAGWVRQRLINTSGAQGRPRAARTGEIPRSGSHSGAVGVHCAQAGIPIVRIQRLLGHSTPVMTLRYMKHAPDDYFTEDATRVAALRVCPAPLIEKRTRRPRGLHKSRRVAKLCCSRRGGRVAEGGGLLNRYRA